jgi:hypothetical protein
MLRLPNPAAQQACSDHNIAVECLKLFPRYRFEVIWFSLLSFACCSVVRSLAPHRWHSILHSTVLNMITAVLSSPETLDAALRGGLLQASTQTRHVLVRFNVTLGQAITAAARQDIVDGKPHRLSYMAQVVKIVVALKDIAKKVRECCSLLCCEYVLLFGAC